VAIGGDEQELVERLHRDDPRALAALFDRYGDRTHNHCFRHLADWADAQDATSSVFLEVWRHRRRVPLTPAPRPTAAAEDHSPRSSANCSTSVA
jgi:DNA-directed RNA polymerase specialized sigma24 family protein